MRRGRSFGQKRRNHSDDEVELVKDPASDRSAGEKDMQERLLGALSQLDPAYHEMLILWSVHGYTDAQIAEMLGKTRGAVAVTMHRARQRLKELLGGGSKDGAKQ